MNLHFSWKTFSIQRGPHEHLGQLGGASSLDLDKGILLDDVGHLLLLLLTLVHFLLKLRDLLVDRVKSVPIWRPICERADECRVRVLEGLQRVRR